MHDCLLQSKSLTPAISPSLQPFNLPLRTYCLVCLPPESLCTGLLCFLQISPFHFSWYLLHLLRWSGLGSWQIRTFLPSSFPPTFLLVKTHFKRIWWMTPSFGTSEIQIPSQNTSSSAALQSIQCFDLANFYQDQWQNNGTLSMIRSLFTNHHKCKRIRSSWE